VSAHTATSTVSADTNRGWGLGRSSSSEQWRGVPKLEIRWVDLGIGNEYFTFHLIGIAKEQRELAAKFGDHSIRSSDGDHPITDLAERSQISRMKTNVVDTAAAKHRGLVIGLIIAIDLEHVEFRSGTQIDDDHPRATWKFRAVPFDGGLKHVNVELLEPIAVARNRGYVIYALK
jgi:hypothetical protein